MDVMPAAAYADQVRQIFPRGAAFDFEADSEWLKLLDGLSQELARIDARAARLIEEMDPRTTSELLPDFERELNLPNPLLTAPPSTEARRNAVVAQLTKVGGVSRAYFIALALSLGYAITITEYQQFQAGISHAGDAITNGAWVNTWQVNGTGNTFLSIFRAGQSGAGDPLRTWDANNVDMQATLAANKPAHTQLNFSQS